MQSYEIDLEGRLSVLGPLKDPTAFATTNAIFWAGRSVSSSCQSKYSRRLLEVSWSKKLFRFFWLLCYVCSLQWTKILSTYGDLAISFDSFGHSHWRGLASRSEVQTLQRGLDRWPSGRGVPSRTWSMQQCLSSTFVFRIGLFFWPFSNP